MTHAKLIRWHMLTAAFLFPAILLFLATGALYTWGIKGDYASAEYDVALTAPLTKDKDALQAVATAELARRQIALPSGAASVKSMGDAFQLEWTGTRRDVLLDPTADAMVAKLTVKDTGWHRWLVQMHKAKGGTAFKIYAVVLALGLLFLVVSGLLMAWRVRAMKRPAILASAAGLAAFIGIALIS